MKALIIGEVLQGILLGVYSTEPQRSKAMDIFLAARNYYETGVEPNTDGTLLHADTWSIIKRECDKFIEADEAYHNAKAEAGRKGGLMRVSKLKQTQANSSKPKQNEAVLDFAQAKASKSKQTQALEENKNKNNTKEKENKEKERYIGFIGDFKKSVKSMGVCADPVDLAMRITNQTSTLARRTYGSLLHKLGHETFSEVCYTLQSEIKAGEIPENLGATLTHRLQQKLK